MIYPKSQRKQRKILDWDLVVGNIRALNCFNTYYMYYIVKK